MSTDSGTWPFEVFTPAGLDLGSLDGRTGVVATRRAINDADGLLYGVTPDDGAWANFARLGDVQLRHGQLGYTTIAFHTDDGDVDLLPGETKTVLFEGARYEVAANTAILNLRPGNQGSKCGPPSQVLAYEVLRAQAERDPRTGLAGRAILDLRCGEAYAE